MFQWLKQHVDQNADFPPCLFAHRRKAPRTVQLRFTPPSANHSPLLLLLHPSARPSTRRWAEKFACGAVHRALTVSFGEQQQDPPEEISREWAEEYLTAHKRSWLCPFCFFLFKSLQSSDWCRQTSGKLGSVGQRPCADWCLSEGAFYSGSGGEEDEPGETETEERKTETRRRRRQFAWNRETSPTQNE